jgi:hypothetical protein
MCTLGLDHRKKGKIVTLPDEIGKKAVNTVIEEHPRIGEILQKFDVGCVTCSVGICLVNDVVAIHALGDEIEAQIETQIKEYLAVGKAV